MKHNPFDQGEIRSGELTTASSNNAEMPSAQASAQEIPTEKTTSETGWSDLMVKSPSALVTVA